MKQITEILDGINQGVTEAILCRAEDGRSYVVKSHKRAGSNALIGEWLSARIGVQLKLPIPPIELLSLDKGLAPYLLSPHVSALESAPNFGSELVRVASEFAPELNGAVSESLRARILFFDRWIRNQDRTDFNPNLLWVAHAAELHVIDHNMAFDPSFDESVFWETHIFRDCRGLWDATFRQEIFGAARHIIRNAERFWNELPEEWTDTAGAMSLDDVVSILTSIDNPTLW